jgi:ParB family chromosome partitioning protein
MRISLSAIYLPKNIRTQLEGIEDLAASIHQNGLMHPLVVTLVDGCFELVAGARRYAALKMLGRDTVSVRIVNAEPEKVHVLRLIENIQRQELSGVEEINAVAELFNEMSSNQAALARAIGKSPAYVSRCVRASKLIKTLDCDVAKLSKSVLFELADAEDPKAMLQTIVKGEGSMVSQIRMNKPSRQGRSAGKAIVYKEFKHRDSFMLKIKYSESDDEPTRKAIIAKMREVLKKLERT